MKPLCLVSVFLLLGSTDLADAKEPAAEDSITITVTVVGTLRTGIFAIGGETPVNEKATLEAKVGRENSRVRFLTEGDKTIIDITSEFGIDNATIRRKSEEWPKSILVRLHLGGLESFKASSGNVAVEWSVASTGDHATRTSLVSGKRVAALDDQSPYYTKVRIVGGNGKTPLKGGYFEVPMPAKLFEGNPEEITLEWIDFYRN